MGTSVGGGALPAPRAPPAQLLINTALHLQRGLSPARSRRARGSQNRTGPHCGLYVKPYGHQGARGPFTGKSVCPEEEHRGPRPTPSVENRTRESFFLLCCRKSEPNVTSADRLSKEAKIKPKMQILQKKKKKILLPMIKARHSFLKATRVLEILH